MRVFGSFILLTAFILQALVPAGFMPSFKDGQMTIEICSGVTGEIIEISYGEEQIPPHQDRSGADKCPYTSIVSYLYQDMAPALTANAYVAYMSAPLTGALIAQHHFPSRYTRGPPQISPA